ncbi:hypothetical protein Patl1_18920 [Pistacia atlantica]|uniref:Uncharacterized protein n=1 Tax=Pistacia atlantica TaxID=434234 RepID=A0ACC1C2L2_9ROSI|nr:hypothetical protein Patl1_18920 [Pistacia atlantica]
MYGQGSYNSQFGRGPNTPVPPPYQRQQLPGPPPLPPNFQPGKAAPPRSVIQPGLPMYQHGFPGPPPGVCQVPPPSSVPNTSQSYAASHLGPPNVHHMPPSVLSHPPRVLPPPPPRPTMYSAPVHMQSQQPGGVQDLQRIPPPPTPQPTSSFFTSSSFGSYVKSTGGNSHPSIAPFPAPLPPSSPPPVPPSPPSSTSPLSSMHHQVGSNLTSFNEPSSSKLSTSSSVGKNLATNEGKHVRDVTNSGYINQEGSLVGDSSSLGGHVIFDLPPPPPIPPEGKVVQKIEELCKLIAKNGLGYEDFVRRNESGNSEFQFLFAGDPGSEAAIAHEYYLWMKKKYILFGKLNEEKIDSRLKPLVPFSSQTDSLVVAPGSISPADSDMEMEDDITQSVNDKGGNLPAEGANNEFEMVTCGLDAKKQLHVQQLSTPGEVSFSSFAGEKVVSSNDQLAIERPLSRICSPVINSVDVWPSASNLKKSATLLAHDKIAPGVSGAADGLNPEKNSSQLIKGVSPFRLLQEYASDDECVGPIKDSSSLAVGATSLLTGTKSQYKTESGFGLHSGLNVFNKSANFPEVSGTEVKENATASLASEITGEQVDKHEKQASSSHVESPQALREKDHSEGACVEASLNGKFQKENEEKGAKSASNLPKVDKFGRLVREGASDSDSDDLSYNGRQKKRGRSRSRSPLDRRRRRSPRRRREKRSRSRSWSPRNRRSRSRSPRNRRSRSRSPRNRRSRSRSPRRRRSRSRSPVSRHVGDFSGDSMRRERGQIPECFDFRRGRCYRGASCRYLHHDSDKGEGSKRHRSKQQYLDVPPIPENSNIHEDMQHNLSKASDKVHDEVKITEMQHRQDVPGSSSGRLIDSHRIKSGSSREAAAKVSETQFLEGQAEVPTLTNKIWQESFESQHLKLVVGFPPYASKKELPLEKSVVEQSQPHLSEPVPQNPDCPRQLTDNSSVSDFAPEQTSMTTVNKFPVNEALQNTENFRHHSPQLPPPPPPLSQGITAQHMTQPPQDASFPHQSTSGERFPSYMLPNQPSHFSVSSVASWTSLPPPPPGVSTQLQQSHLAPRDGSQFIPKPYTAELPTPSQVGDFQQRTYSMQESHRSLSHAEDYKLKPLPPYNLTQLPMMGTSVSSFSQGKNQPLPSSFSLELPANRMQNFPGDKLPPGERIKSASQIHPYLQQQQPPYGLPHLAAANSSSRYPPDLQETNQSSHLPDLRGSRNSTHYGPYTSTLEQPPSSKFSSDVLRQEQDTSHFNRHAAAFGLSHGQVDGQNIGSTVSRQATSSPNSARAVGQNFPRSGGDQYDPLLDSIDPSSNLSKSKEYNNAQKLEPSSDSDIMLRHSGSNKPLDVEENNRKKEVGGVEVATSVDDEEYGETADAEVGAVENESPSNPIHAASIPAGEIEIDQIKSPGKSRKNKESRSMKLFKAALADFVKEVLKPSWRQGNMSKEAFKTIVKKTVDKVSGAMKSHQIPKSRAKIDQYIDSSQRKLTKLVTGYVDKYVKM